MARLNILLPNAFLSAEGDKLVYEPDWSRLALLHALSLCICRRQYPGAAAGSNPRSSLPAISAFPAARTSLALSQ